MNSLGSGAFKKAVPSIALGDRNRPPRATLPLGPAGVFLAAALALTAPGANAQTGTYTDLGNGGYAISITRGVSDDGSAAAVTAGSNVNTPSDHSFLWKGGSLTPLQDYGYGSAAASISADGTVIAGNAMVNALQTQNHAVIWNSSGTMTDLGAGVTGGDFAAMAISADGKTVVAIRNSLPS